MKLSEIRDACYVKVEKVAGGVKISPIHLYLECSHLNRDRSTINHIVIIEPEAASPLFVGELLDGVRVCQRCRNRREKLAPGT